MALPRKVRRRIPRHWAESSADLLDYAKGLVPRRASSRATVFVKAFRAWLRLQPVEFRNGEGEVTVSRPRAPAAVEAAIAQLIAALNHAVNADPPRSDKRPTYKPLPASQVQRKRRSRIGVPELAEMVAYAAESGKRRGSLHAFLVGSICTIARPSAVCDISVAPDRQQWWPGAPTLDLNPHGRPQTKKFRPIVPVLPLLEEWLAAELETYQALTAEQRVRRGWLRSTTCLVILKAMKGTIFGLLRLAFKAKTSWRMEHPLACLRSRPESIYPNPFLRAPPF